MLEWEAQASEADAGLKFFYDEIERMNNGRTVAEDTPTKGWVEDGFEG